MLPREIKALSWPSPLLASLELLPLYPPLTSGRSPAVWSLPSIALARFSLLFNSRRGLADPTTLPFFWWEKRGRYQKDIPKVCLLHDGFILIMGAEGLKARSPCGGHILAERREFWWYKNTREKKRKPKLICLWLATLHVIGFRDQSDMPLSNPFDLAEERRNGGII